MAASFEKDNESSVFMRGGVFLDQLSNKLKTAIMKGRNTCSVNVIGLP